MAARNLGAIAEACRASMLERRPQLALTKQDARTFVDCVIEHIIASAARHEDVRLYGFGTFYPHYRPARAGRNPATGKRETFAARYRLQFRPSKAVNTRLNPVRRAAPRGRRRA